MLAAGFIKLYFNGISSHAPVLSLSRTYIPLLTEVQWGVVFTWLTSPHPVTQPHPGLGPTFAPFNWPADAIRDERNQTKAVHTHSSEWRMG